MLFFPFPSPLSCCFSCCTWSHLGLHASTDWCAANSALVSDLSLLMSQPLSFPKLLLSLKFSTWSNLVCSQLFNIFHVWGFLLHVPSPVSRPDARRFGATLYCFFFVVPLLLFFVLTLLALLVTAYTVALLFLSKQSLSHWYLG